jgi:8-oxo-dGTP diphosphatase
VNEAPNETVHGAVHGAAGAREERTIRAAGGVVWRPGPAGREVCLVHRSRYDDWSLPKGKLHEGEHPLAGAVREIEEESGVTALPQVRLPAAGYRMPTGAAKRVDYWSMLAVGGPGFTPSDEVDEVSWVPLAEAAGRLSYDHDVGVVDAAAALPAVTAVVVLLRHTYAGDRAEWTGPDAARPLDERGRRHAERLGDLLAAFAPGLGPGSILSARPDRCRQTLEPLAGRLGLPVVSDRTFDETADPVDAVDTLLGLATSGRPATLVCSQGKLIPRVLGLLLGEPPDGYATRKGDSWLIAFAARPAAPTGIELVGLDRLTSPPT